MGRSPYERPVGHAALAVLLAASGLGCQVPGEDADLGGAADPLGSFEEDQRAAVARNPEGHGFEVRILSPTRVFHHGERIPIEISFAGGLPPGYSLDRRAFEPGARLETETYHLSPASGTSDPLRDYFDGDYHRRAPSCGPMVDAQQDTFVFDLNEWARFDAPGRYRLYVDSSRLEREREVTETDILLDRVSATSAIVTLSILPHDDAWSARALDEATRAFDAAEAADEREGMRAAARVLRFLDTPGAAREMAARFTGDGTDLELGLGGSPYRADALAVLEARLDARDAPVTMSVLELMARLRVLESTERIGSFPGEPAAEKRWREGEVVIYRAHDEALTGYVERLAARLPAKRGAARATSVETLLEIAWMRSSGGRAAPPWFAQLTALLPEVFADLPAERAQALLEYRWRKIASPAMLPVLRSILDGRADDELRVLALKRLRELAPEEWRARVLAAVAAPGLSLGMQAFPSLAALPDAVLPELDDALATHLERAMEAPGEGEPALASKLVARYATAAVAERIRAARPSRDEARGDVDGALLAYFARVDPAQAEPLIEGALARARESKGSDGLADLDAAARLLAEYHPGDAPAGRAAIERALLQALDEDDPWLAATAARALGHAGSAAALPRLWRRLERFHAVWRGRAAEMRARRAKSGLRDEAWLETALSTAIALGSGWLADGPALDRLSSLLLSALERQQIERMRGVWTEAPLVLSVKGHDGGDFAAEIAQYRAGSLAELDKKLAQLPRGTRVTFQPYELLPEDEERIEAMARTCGLRLDR